ASFVYEIAWIRMLSLVLGSATHSFELMLSAFILGLALGSFWTRGRADRFRDPLRTLGLAQCAMGLLALATLPVYGSSFAWTAGLVLLPRIGLEPMLAGGALLDMELGALVLVAALPGRRPLAYGAAVAGLLIAGLVMLNGRFSPLVLASGVYRTGAIPQPGSH